MISDTKFLSQLKLVKGAIKTPKSFAHKYSFFVLNFNICMLKRTFHLSLTSNPSTFFYIFKIYICIVRSVMLRKDIRTHGHTQTHTHKYLNMENSTKICYIALSDK